MVLLGAGGMLGRAFATLLHKQGISLRAFTRVQCDIGSEDAVAAAIEPGTSHVINCAAYTNVDAAEGEGAMANMRINGVAPGFLARRCSAVGAMLVHYSTDYVFDGRGTQPYPVDAPMNPINAYGRAKAAGGWAVRAGGARYLLIRSSWLYAPWGKNFVRTIAKLASTRETLTVVDDQHGRPTSCEQLAATTLALLNSEAEGIWHATDGGECTWFEFAAEIATRLNLDCDIQPCTSAAYPRPALRPAYSVLDLSRTIERVGAPADWRTCLADVLRRLEPL